MSDYISREAAIDYIREKSEEMIKAFEELGGESGIYADAYNDLAEYFHRIPAADVASVVHCKDCVYSRELTLNEKRVYFQGVVICTNPEVTDGIECGRFGSDFCSEGVRKEAPNGGDTD